MAEETSKRVIESGVNVFEFLALTFVNLASFVLPPPIRRDIEYEFNRLRPNVIVDPGALVELYQRGEISLERFLGEMQKNGFNPERATQLLAVRRRLADVSEIVEMRKRGEIDLAEYQQRAEKLGIDAITADKLFNISLPLFDPNFVVAAWRRGAFQEGGAEDLFEDLIKQGWSKSDIEVFKKVTEFIPSPQDIVTFMGREVFEPKTIEEIGLEEEWETLKPQGLPFFRKAGVPEEVAKMFWIAHWQHPSFTQIQEMIHRGIIKSELFDTWAKLVEFPPFWRKALFKSLFVPFTRVDIRRMHKFGVLSREEVKRAYQDIGYDEEKAEKMTEFTIKANENPEEAEKTEADKRKEELRGLSRSIIIKGYKMSRISRDTARQLLLDIGLSEEVADFYLVEADFEIADDKENKLISQYRNMYVNGIIDFNKANDLLDKLNIPAAQKAELFEVWDLEKVGKQSLPSKTELIAFAKKKIISSNMFRTMMSALGYDDMFIEWYVQANKI